MITTDRMAMVDRNAAALGVPRKQLMESSGNAVARAVRERAEEGDRVTLVCGRGNNGGDAMVAARFLEGFDLRVVLLGRPETISTQITRENWAALGAAEVPTETVTDSRSFDLDDPDVVVDAMLGTGVTGALREPEATVAEALNAADATVVAVDVPSGVDADTGAAEGAAVDADAVVTFHDTKPGFDDFDAEVVVEDIGIPDAAETFTGPGDLLSIRRSPGATKGDAGRAFVIGGGPYTGAPALASQAALRAGVDLSFVAVPESVKTPIQSYAEDLIVQPYEGDHLAPDHVDDLVDTAESHDDVVVIGPGLGSHDETVEAAERFLSEFEGRAVVDADALPVIPEVDTDATLVLTPNRKELVELGGPDVDDLRANQAAIADLSAELGHVVLAKAKDDVITDGERTRVCRAGTPGMTVGGTGDTLAGITAAMLATHDPFEAACMAPQINGSAAEAIAGEVGDGLLASDLLDAIPRAVWGDESDE
ncbi:bifunctional ADP-dependent NAD(P)H-hydrate dehydratase/NAD(P)H-hydrate epimerase [Candidatus Halobonum tyrrellensis]|uniref:Bifunctional NAD(P)H-hydrate repair enzyme n=1 Tax=Candidatus Halobonum tyrrellensis G22 TaxID=1324957 RepID=V4HC58_9EURY|nr:bifunctional ADP-dependent NAD(P)H-hydrate dehydratase/NAD(P)H-hydrate epimerase [Candidatus Halobonum tyrrellensis]ESP87643.1 carbohydrate kinase [Candidatus Halobonum tyrrellensis G22]